MNAMNYLIRKLIIQFSLPLGLTIILFLYGFFRNKKRYLISSFILIYFSSINIVSETLIKFIEYPQIAQQNLDVKTIVVLSGGIIKYYPNNNGVYEWNDPDRFFAGINLYKKHESSKLVFTGGINPFKYNSKSEGEILKKKSKFFVNNFENIIVSGNAKNTFEESKEIKKLIINSKISNNIILITSAFHMKRAKIIFEKEGIKVNPYSVDFRSENISLNRIIKNPLNWIPNSDSLNKTSIALKEIYGILIYKLL